MTRELEDLVRLLIREESRRGHEESSERLAAEIRLLREELRGSSSGGRCAFLTVDEAAEISRHSADTVRKWVTDGRLSRCGTSRKLLVRDDELRNLLTASCPGRENVVDMQKRVRDLLGEG